MKLTRLFIGTVAALTVVATPASADAAERSKQRAKVRTLVGHVVGQPYSPKKGQTAIPVLLYKTNARKAGLGSAAGVLIVKKKTVSVAGEQKRMAPALLRIA